MTLNGCSEEIEHNNTLLPSKIELLQGDWVTEKHQHGSYLLNFHISIEDSMFTLFSEYSDSVYFTINKDFITVYHSNDTITFGSYQNYYIDTLNHEKLVLIAKSKKVKKRLVDFSFNSDTLFFSKVHKKNDLKPLRIAFSSTGCYGSCPSMKIEVEDDLSVKFYGSIYSDIEGGYEGEIDNENYKRLINQVQYLELDSLKTEYIASWTDDQTKYLIIETVDTIYKTKVYGAYQQPVELTILLNNLMDLYKRLDLEESEHIDDLKSFDKFLKISYPIQPPPIPELIE